jgi:hypothetical protein
LNTHRCIAGFCTAVLIWSVCAVAQTPPPDLKPGQAVSVREGDTWSSATLQKKEGRRYLIKYDDGKEEWVTADRLRAGDAGATGGAPATPSDTPAPAKGPAAGPAVSLEGPFTQITLQPVKGVNKRATAPVVVKPTTRPSETFTDLSPAAGGGWGQVDDVVICPDTPNVVIAIGGRQGDDTSLLRLDITNPSATETRVLTAKEHRVMAAADGGNWVITQPTTWGSQTMSIWEYVNSQYELRANYAFVANGENKRPDWARLLSPTRLLMRSGFGETYLIDLRAKRQLGYLQCGDLTVHSSGHYIVSTKDQAGIIIRASDLSIVAEAPKAQSSFCLDATGTHVAAGDSNTITVTKLANKQQVAQIAGISDRGPIQLLDPASLLVGGNIYYDLKTGIPVWNYKVPNGKSVLLGNGQILFVGAENGQVRASMATLPDPEAAKALKSASPDQFVISPGAKIAIAGDLNAIGNAAEVRKNLEKAITSARHKLDDNATQFKLTLTTAAGPTDKFAVREFQMQGPPVVREVDAPSTITTVVLTKDGETIWQREIKFSAQVMVMRKKEQSLEAAVAEAGKPNPGRLGGLDLPSYLVKSTQQRDVATLGESTLTNTGFVATPPGIRSRE